MVTIKKPHRTAQRILALTRSLFSRFGEPDVSATLIAAELRIRPGKLCDHSPAKDGLTAPLGAADRVRHGEDAWRFFHMLYEPIWQHRFADRKLNDLLSKNRRLKTHYQSGLAAKGQAMCQVLTGLQYGGVPGIAARKAGPVANSMVGLLSDWLRLRRESVLDPRHALKPTPASPALMRGAFQVLGLLLPYLEPVSKDHLLALAGQYQSR